MIPRLLDRYIIREFVLIFLVSMAGFLFVCLVGDAAERLNDFVDSRAPLKLILLFYVNQVPYYLIFVLPASSLIATLFTLGQFSKHNELTAMLAAGVSMGRVFLPVMILMLGVSAAAFALNETIVPEANRNKEEIQDYRIRGRARPQRGFRRNVDYQGEGGRRWVANLFRLEAGAFDKVRLIGFSGPPEGLEIEYRIDAESAHYISGGNWRFTDGTMRYFPAGGREEQVVRFEEMVLTGLKERPADFVVESRDPQQMTFAELKKEIRRLYRNGLRTARAETELWFKTSLPVANFIIVLFGAPLAVTRRRMGPGVGIALGVVVYMLFMGSYYIFRSMGYSEVISPLMAAWGSNVLFAVAGVATFLKVRK
ncbi:MAG: YjgP/YjgQ family permease [Candidatus Glassbacteria bacterium]|nr:YjgP/YjgQ family permease [Candidatus Glassbacteria bacterium]